MWSRQTAHPGPAAAALRSLGESAALIGWELADGAQCTVAAVGGSVEVYLVRQGTVVQVKRFATPGPAFDAARAWRREVELCSEEGQ